MTKSGPLKVTGWNKITRDVEWTHLNATQTEEYNSGQISYDYDDGAVFMA